jgi:uroporphyrinogen-III decarboxylase
MEPILSMEGGMAMTSREGVLAAFAHEETDAVPAWCGASPEFWAKAKAALGLDDEGLRRRLGDDFRRLTAPWRDPGPPLAAGSTWRSPFGVERSGIGYGQPLSHPLAGTASEREILDYPWPDSEDVDVSDLRDEASLWGGEYAVLGGDWSPFWHDAIDLVGMEGLYFLMYDEPELASLILGKVTDFYLGSSERIFDEAGDLIDVFFIGNDFGSTTGPLIGPELFDRFIAPCLRRLIDLGHSRGFKVMLHCCGGFRPLIPLMIRDGLDALHALQPHCAGMDPAGLKRDFGERLLLNGAIDSQSVLIEGSPASVREETLRTLAIMAPGGGYVAGASHDYLLEETPLENVLAMFDAIREYKEKRHAT